MIHPTHEWLRFWKCDICYYWIALTTYSTLLALAVLVLCHWFGR